MLNRIKNIKYDICLILALAYMIKMLSVSASIADSIIMIGCLSLLGVSRLAKDKNRLQYKLFLKSRPPKSTPNKALLEDLANIKSDVSKLTMTKTVSSGTSKRMF